MSLMTTFRDDLLDSILLLAFLMFAQPNQRKPPPTKQFNLIKAIRKPIPKRLCLLITEIIRVFLFPFPFYFYLLKRIIFLGVQSSMGVYLLLAGGEFFVLGGQLFCLVLEEGFLFLLFEVFYLFYYLFCWLLDFAKDF